MRALSGPQGALYGLTERADCSHILKAAAAAAAAAAVAAAAAAAASASAAAASPAAAAAHHIKFRKDLLVSPRATNNYEMLAKFQHFRYNSLEIVRSFFPDRV